jgi:hypothetical protein
VFVVRDCMVQATQGIKGEVDTHHGILDGMVSIGRIMTLAVTGNPNECVCCSLMGHRHGTIMAVVLYHPRPNKAARVPYHSLIRYTWLFNRSHLNIHSIPYITKHSVVATVHAELRTRECSMQEACSDLSTKSLKQ